MSEEEKRCRMKLPGRNGSKNSIR